MKAKLAQRFFIICLFALWFGGLTFYTGIVIPVGGKVLGSNTEQGFVTQQVTNWLNGIGAVGTLLLGWNLKSLWRKEDTFPKKRLAATWVVVLLSQMALIILHPVLDRLTDAVVHSVNEPVEFHRWHEMYEMGVTILWCGGMSHLWYLLRSWHVESLIVSTTRDCGANTREFN